MPLLNALFGLTNHVSSASADSPGAGNSWSGLKHVSENRINSVLIQMCSPNAAVNSPKAGLKIFRDSTIVKSGGDLKEEKKLIKK